jgi:adenylate cyclase, class 2
MKTEIEVKFLHVDFEKVRERLLAIGAVCEQPMRLMRRVLYENDNLQQADRDAFVRLRDEGNKVTLTLKEFKNNSLTGAQEREVVVSDFDGTVMILKELGIEHHTLHESRRETWSIKFADDRVEIVLDEWPWLDTYIEIEGPSEDAVKETADSLGFLWEDASFGSVDVAYKEQYPDMKTRGVIDVPEVRFGLPVPPEFGESNL